MAPSFDSQHNLSSGDSEANGGDIIHGDILEPIAIIGYSHKFPQEADTPEGFWKMIFEKRSAMTDWPKERLTSSSFYHPNNERPDSHPVRGAHFIKEDLKVFDASFFSIPSLEAASMDSGIPMEKAFGTKTSVHTGSFSDDFKTLIYKDLETLPKYGATGFSMTLIANRISWFFGLSGQSCNIDTACSSSLIALDVACQGLRNCEAEMGIVAGSNSLLGIETFLSLGNYGLLSPDGLCYSFDSRANGYSRGEGYGVVLLKRLSDAIEAGDTIRAVIRSTGSNQDGHTQGITNPSQEAQEILIEEVYRKADLDLGTTRYFEAHGTGTQVGDLTESNAIGRVFGKYRSRDSPLFIGAVKSNLGHLEGASGVAGLIKAVMVLERGIIPPNANFETLNPTIDAEFLKLTFPQTPTPWPGKGLRRASINSFGFGGANAHVVVDDAYNYLKLRSLRGNHSTVSEPPSIESLAVLHKPMSEDVELVRNGVVKQPPPRIFTLSASDEAGVRRLSEVYKPYFDALKVPLHSENEYLANLAHTLYARRSSLAWKSTFIARDIIELRNFEKTLSRPRRVNQSLGIGYIFTGQGAQVYQMGRDLLHYSTFSRTLLDASDCLQEIGCEWSLMEELLREKNSSKINSPEYSQPLCTALQIALVNLLEEFGVKPCAVVGHSSGEIAAAYAVGGLSLASACKVAYFRGKLAATLVPQDGPRGSMMSIGLSAAQVQPYLASLSTKHQALCIPLPMIDQLVIACVNSPKNITVSGPEKIIDCLQKLLESDGVFARKLKVDVAYHSPQMNSIAAQYLELLGTLQKRTILSGVPKMASSVTGELITADEICDPNYWVQNMVSPVQFVSAVKRIITQTPKDLKKKMNKFHKSVVVTNHLVELGPHSALQGPIKDIIATSQRKVDVTYLSILNRNVSAIESTLDSMAKLYCLGYPISLDAINTIQRPDKGSSGPVSLPDLPEYPFDHSQSYWHESRLNINLRHKLHPRLDLLGTHTNDWNPLEAKWRKITKISETPWVEDHKINGTVIYPAAGMLVMAIEGMRLLAEPNRKIRAFHIKNATFNTPLTISLEEGTETEFHIRPLGDINDKTTGWSEFRLYMHKDNRWAENCRGTIELEYEEVHPTEVDGGKEHVLRTKQLQEVYRAGTDLCHGRVEKKAMYEHIRTIGLDLGPSFQGLDNIAYSNCGNAIAEFQTFSRVGEESVENHNPIVHPASLDSFAQIIFVALTKGGQKIIPTTIPTRIHDIWISGKMINEPILQTHARSIPKGFRTTESSLVGLEKGTGEVLLTAKFETTTVASPNQSQDTNSRQHCYNIVWKPDITHLSTAEMEKFCSGGRLAKACPDKLLPALRSLILAAMETLDLDTLENNFEMQNSYLKEFIRWGKEFIETYSGNEPEQNLELHSLEPNAIEGEMDWLSQVCQHLPKILQGSMDVQSLPLRISTPVPASPEAKKINTLNSYLELLAHKYPGLRVLDISHAKTGPNVPLLSHFHLHPPQPVSEDPTLPQIRYRYAHHSSEFLDTVQKEFPSVEVQKFVLNAPLSTQAGFDPMQYDVIIIDASVYNPNNIESTLKELHTLLRDMGKLIITNTTPSPFTADFILRLLPECDDWWPSKSTQSHLRVVPAEEWHSVLNSSDLWCPEEETIMLQDCTDIKTRCIGTLVTSRRLSKVPEPVQASLKVVAFRRQQSTVLSFQNSLHYNSQLQSEILYFDDAPTMSSKGFYIFLLEVENPFLSTMTATQLTRLQNILDVASGVVWVTGGGGDTTSDPCFQMIDGLARSLRSENATVRFVTLALAPDTFDKRYKMVTDVITRTLSQGLEEYEPEIREVAGLMNVSRLLEAPLVSEELHIQTQATQKGLQAFGSGLPLQLKVGMPGLLDTLHFVEDKEYNLPMQAPYDVEIEVRAIGVNFMDCLTALGRISQSTMGGELAGVVTRCGPDTGVEVGDRVTAGLLDCFKTFARANPEGLTKIPDSMSWAEAAAIPVAAVTAYWTLSKLARLEAGESVLIHSASGGTGQMAVQIARLLGAEVFVTVGSESKKKLIMDLYTIPDDHIFYSRDLTFAKGIMRMTKTGVDVILNSLAGDGLIASWECIAPFGRFVEIGKRDIHSHGNLPMFPFAKNVSFHAFDLAQISVERTRVYQQSYGPIMQWIREGKLDVARPLHVYPVSEIEDAFRYMQSGTNTGKTVIEVDKNVHVMTVLDTRPTWSFDPCATYVIAGGLGGLGRNVARWMASRGAKYLLLLSRRGPQTQAAKKLVEELETSGVRVMAPACDIASRLALAAVLEEVTHCLPPIKGCIQGTMVLRDGIFQKMTYSDWEEAVRSKVEGSWNLHCLFPRNLDFFVFLSSVSGIFGSGGQANYAAGNTYMDALTHYRISQGEKAVSLDLGWMIGAGVAEENKAVSKSLEATGFLTPISQAEFFALLDRYCSSKFTSNNSESCQVIVGIDPPAKLRAKNIPIPYWMERATFRQLHQMGVDNANEMTNDKELSHVDVFRRAETLPEGSAVVLEMLRSKLSKALSVPFEDLDPEKAMHHFGVDSLLAVELRNWFAKEWGADVAIFDIIGAPNLSAISVTIATRSSLRAKEWLA